MTSKPLATDEDRKQAFLDGARLDKKYYVGLNAEDTISAVRSAAGLTYDKIGPTRQAAEQLVRSAVIISKFAKSATTLGTKLRPLLDEAARDGRIDRDSGVFQMEWPERRRMMQQEMQSELKKIFCTIIGVDPARSLEMTFSELIRQWQRTAVLTRDEIGAGVSSLYYHLNIGSPLEKEQVEQVAHVIAAKLDQGISAGWIDPESKEQLPIKRILQNKLGHYITVNGTETEALLECIEKVRGLTKLPSTAVARMAGGAQNWLSPSNATQVSLSDVARIADIMLPYLKGDKQWSGLEEVELSGRQHEHALARDYFIGKVREYLPEASREQAGVKIDAALNPMPETLGETVKKLREVAGLSQKGMGGVRRQSHISAIERNFLSLGHVEEEGQVQVKGALRGQIDDIAQVIARNIGLERHPKQGPFAVWMQDRIRRSDGGTAQYLAEQWNKRVVRFTAEEITEMSEGRHVPSDDEMKLLARRLQMSMPKTILLRESAREQRELLEQTGIASPAVQVER